MTDRELDTYFKIKDTKYDRHRKVTKDMADQMFLMHYKYGRCLKDIANEFGVALTTVKYNIDRDFRQRVLKSQSGAHVGKDNCLFKERVEYKKKILKELLESKKLNDLLN